MEKAERITLSYREDRVGGKVRGVPGVSDEQALATAQHLVLLIHGYNNDAQAATDAYDGFHDRLCDMDKDARYGIGRKFVEVYWPGDGAWGMASFLYYMDSIQRAIKTAERLATYLAAQVPTGCRIDIIAHSMGCRLAMELLRALACQKSAPGIGRIVFMAGAIPTFMLDKKNPPCRLRPGYDDVLREGARSLYSGADSVLAFAFPAGQSLAKGEEGIKPTALGHALWSETNTPHNLGQIENAHAGHSDYWGWNTEPKALQCAKQAVAQVRSYLQFPSAGSRQINCRFMLERGAGEAREQPGGRGPVGRAAGENRGHLGPAGV